MITNNSGNFLRLNIFFGNGLLSFCLSLLIKYKFVGTL